MKDQYLLLICGIGILIVGFIAKHYVYGIYWGIIGLGMGLLVATQHIWISPNAFKGEKT